MKRLINSTTILSMALYIVPPFAAQAQDFPKVTVDGVEVLCLPDKKADCPDGTLCVVAKKAANCEKNAAAAVAQATADGTLSAGGLVTLMKPETSGGAAATDTTAANQAAADKAAADKAATDKAAADKAAADKAAKQAAKKAAADAAAADQAAADKAAADKAAADQAAADKAAADQAAADKAATDQAAADKAAKQAAKKAAADAAAAEAAAADQTATDKAAADKAAKQAAKKAAADAAAAEAGAATTFPTVTVNGQTFICLPDKATPCPDGATCVVAKNPANCDAKAQAKVDAEMTPVPPSPEDAAALAAAEKAAADAAAAAAADPNVVPVEAPVPTQDAVKTLETALENPDNPDATVTEAPDAAAAGAVPEEGKLPSVVPAPADAVVTTEVVTKDDSRTSDEEFKPAPATVAPGKKTGLSDFEKVGLVALGALAIGAMINGNKQVVSNTGDRVVVRQPDGSYSVYKDDNALLREPGSTVRTENFSDGSTRTIVQRQDGSQIVTIRDATGRVLQRVAYDRTGHGTILIDDLQPETRVDVSTLPTPRQDRRPVELTDTNGDLSAQLAANAAVDVGRTFSLRQIRTIPEVRHLAATIDVNNITFATGSSAIQASEARKLNRLGKLITDMIKRNPNEVFLVEGHTDAVGSAASNLALSDRRAESVAKALIEYFAVPPENLVVQGYGESELKINTLAAEVKNRRVAVRIITPLLRQN
ncbi:MAG: OmpA family protein [bacterium]